MADLERIAQKAKDFRDREEAILVTAEELFIEMGEERVTVEMIAEKVGIGKGTVYKHFESKDEIYLLLMIRYEEQLAERFHHMEVSDEKERLAREYFAFRIKDPQKYMLFDRLERKLAEGCSCPELLTRLHDVRAANFDKLNAIVQARIDEGHLQDVPPHYHVLAAWAIVHGTTALKLSPFYKSMLSDEDDFLNFMLNAGVRFGNKSKKEGDGA